MATRLPKKFWRVIVRDPSKKLRLYDRKSQTYTQESSARESLANFRSRGIDCDLYESEPVVWKLVDTAPPKDMDPLW